MSPLHQTIYPQENKNKNIGYKLQKEYKSIIEGKHEKTEQTWQQTQEAENSYFQTQA